MREEFGDEIKFVLDGGDCKVGLESTIVSCVGDGPRVLRPGSITLSQLRAVVPTIQIGPSPNAPRVPGTTSRHYSPVTPVNVVPSRRLEQVMNEFTDNHEKAAVLAQRPPGRANPYMTWINPASARMRTRASSTRTCARLDKRRRQDHPGRGTATGREVDAVRDRVKRAATAENIATYDQDIAAWVADYGEEGATESIVYHRWRAPFARLPTRATLQPLRHHHRQRPRDLQLAQDVRRADRVAAGKSCVDGGHDRLLDLRTREPIAQRRQLRRLGVGELQLPLARGMRRISQRVAVSGRSTKKISSKRPLRISPAAAPRCRWPSRPRTPSTCARQPRQERTEQPARGAAIAVAGRHASRFRRSTSTQGAMRLAVASVSRRLRSDSPMYLFWIAPKSSRSSGTP